MKYKYTLDKDETRFIDSLKGVYFTSEWLTIKDGLCTIKEGYSWDGATPKIKILGKWIGTPDGRNNELKYPTLWHDVFYQNYKELEILGLKRCQVDYIFLQDMVYNKWELSGLYYSFVRLFGDLTRKIKY